MLQIPMVLIAGALIAGALACAAPALAQQATDAIAPEIATQTRPYTLSDRATAAMAARDAGAPVVAQDWMVVAANPLAAEAGADVLAAGGTAADAMVAVQAVLGLVEPQSSGLGGGAFLVWYDAATGTLTTLDGRETAPLAATPTLFQTDDGEPLGFWDAVIGGLSVGTPGTPALMEAAHRRWGRANWSALLDPAIALADIGFQVSPRMAHSIARDADRLSTFPATAAYFLPGGAPLPTGAPLRNPAYAATLRAMQTGGADAIYHGDIAADIIATLRHAEGNPGVLSLRDLEIYEVIERPAVCAAFRDMEVCGMGPPSSGALSVGQILGMAGTYDLTTPQDPNAWRIIGDASRLAFADRGRYMADSDYVPMPTDGLIDPAYIAARAALLDTDMALETIAPGTPTWDHAQIWADDQSLEFPSTSHISIVDSYGNVLSMTTTIENGFGSRLMTPGGFLLNNELTDFSFRTHAEGAPIANRLEPGKRPRSSMAPTIVMRDGAPILAIGSPGGSRIIGYVATAIIAHTDWGLDIQDAIALPHALNRFGTYDLEQGTAAEALAPELEALGYEVNIRPLTSGLHAIALTPNGLMGGADPRREGIALGQ